MDGADSISSAGVTDQPNCTAGLLITYWHSAKQSEAWYASPGLGSMLEISLEDLTIPSDLVFTVVHPEDLPRIIKIDTTARQSQSEWQAQFRVNLPGGTKTVEAYVCYLQRSEQPLMRYMFLQQLTVDDPIDQPARNEAIRADLEGIVELSPGGHYAIRLAPDGNSKLIYASRKVQQILGLDMEEFMLDARKMFTHIHPDDKQRFQAGRNEALRKCEFWRVEFRIMKDNGTESWIELTIQPFKQRDGAVIWYGILLNIDQRKNLELARQLAYDQLRESEYKHRMLAENLESPVVIIDEEGTFHYANHAAEYFYGVARVDLIGRKWPDTITPLEWEYRKDIIRRVLRDGKKFTDMWCVSPNNERRYIKRIFIPLNYPGRTTRVLVTVTDVTSEVLLEKMLAEKG